MSRRGAVTVCLGGIYLVYRRTSDREEPKRSSIRPAAAILSPRTRSTVWSRLGPGAAARG
ncbi:hypothetical protein ACFXMT_50555 [Streptomyces mirabilis]|uniref:hypothetical protein n=1 Tax=Streptomyces mirabilis TaxID=68239 RepID=UPI003692682B